MEFNFHNTSKRSIRLFFIIISIIIFAVTALSAFDRLYLNAIGNDQCAWRVINDRPEALLITDVVPGGVTDKAGIKDGDILLKLNGESFKTSRRAVNIVNSVPRGGTVVYTIERDGKQMEFTVKIIKVFDVVFLASYLFGLVFFIVGFILVMSRPEGITQRLFMYFGMISMLTGPNLRIITAAIPQWITNALLGITAVLFPIVFINFVYLFPVRRKDKYKNLIMWSLVFLMFCTYAGVVIQSRGILLPDFVVFISNNIGVLTLITGLVILEHSYFKYVEKKKRKPLRIVLISSLISLSALFYIFYLNSTNTYIIFIKPVLLLPGLLIVVFPLAFGYSIFKYRLMDTEIIVKKSIIYGAVTAAIASIYLIIVLGIGSFVSSLFGRTENEALSIISLVVIAFVFDPLKRYFQNSVDRIFYRERYSYHNALLSFSKVLPFQMNLKETLDSVISTVSNTMHIDKIAGVVLDGGKDITCFSKNIPEQYCYYSKEPEGIIGILESTKAPINVSTLYDERYYRKISEKEKDNIEHGNIQLIIPMISHNKVIGFINTGPKLSEKPYSQDDIDLLSTVANQTAIAIENSRLYEQEKELFKVQEEMKLAYKIQSEWIPKSPPQIEGYDIAGKTIPAEVVGGDYFDYIEINEHTYAFCIGDVSGKGLPAALMMANTQAILKSQALSALSPAECIDKTNRLICLSSSDEIFVTLFYGIIDLKRNSLTYSNAGHNYPVLYSAGKVQFLSEGGLPLGVQSNSRYNENSVMVKKNDVLVMYTDGVNETFNKNWEEFGEERLIKAVQCSVEKTSSGIIDKILEDINSFKQERPAHDDLTLVVIKGK